MEILEWASAALIFAGACFLLNRIIRKEQRWEAMIESFLTPEQVARRRFEKFEETLY